MRVSLKYGKQTKDIFFPEGTRVDILQPATAPLLDGPAAALAQALESPLGDADIRSLPEPGSVGVALPDETRPFPVRELLPVLFEFLQAAWPGLDAGRITVYVGGGLHPPMDEDGLARVVPPEIRAGVRVVPHDAKNDAMSDLGVTSRGVRVLINKGFAESDLRIVMGQIDPHQFVGFTGGSKGACIGLAGAETIRSNHAMMFEPGAEVGLLDDNPVRQDLNEAGDMLGIHLAINVVNDPHKRPVWLGAGVPREVLREGAAACAKVYGVRIDSQYDIVVASCGGHPKDICLYQAQKGLNMASRAAKPGGKVLLLAACAQGVGDDDYYEYVCGFDNMQAVMDDFGSGDFRMGAHKAFLFGRSILAYEVALHSELDKATLSRCHLTPGDARETVSRWLEEMPEARVAVVSNANTTYFHHGPAPQHERI